MSGLVGYPAPSVVEEHPAGIPALEPRPCTVAAEGQCTSGAVSGEAEHWPYLLW